MEITQVYNLVNQATSEILGQTDILKEDLSNVVDVGTQIFNANALDKYVNALVNHIGKVIFVNRPYSGSVPSVLMDAWEFGSVLEKVSMDLPVAQENESWELVDGQTYDPNVFYQPKVTAKFFNKRVTFEIPISITELQVRQSFSNGEQLNAFISMIYSYVEKSMVVKTDALVMRTINNMIGETITSDYATTALNSKTGVKAINLLYKYNQQFGTTLTKEEAILNKDFIRYASYQIKLTADRMTRLTTLFNAGGKDRFTPRDLMHLVLLSDFSSSADIYLQSDTFHDDLVKLPMFETVPYWQGTGLDYSFSKVSSINITTSDGNAIATDGIIGVIFDRDALGVSNFNRRVPTNYNGKAEFFNYFFKMDAGYFNDLNENFVVFFLA